MSETSPTGQDASRVRTGAASREMAAVRHLVIGAHRLAGRTDTAAGLRHHAGSPAYLLTTAGIT